MVGVGLTDVVGVGLTDVVGVGLTDVVTDVVTGSEAVTDVVTDVVGVVSNSSEEEEVYEETVWSTVGSEEVTTRTEDPSNIHTLNDTLNECISMQYNSWDEFWERNNANIIKWMQSNNHM